MTTHPHPFIAVLAATIALIAIAITAGAALATVGAAGRSAGDRVQPLLLDVSRATSAAAIR